MNEINLQAVQIADVTAALAEDVGSGDLSAALADATVRRGVLYCREAAVLCGQAWFEQCFLQLDKNAAFVWQFNDGDNVEANSQVCEVSADCRALLSGERSALNFLQTLSATATTARRLQQIVPQTIITDTRKTLPKLRVAQKYAVGVGGATNHRQGLFDEILIKENHLATAGGIAAALQKAQEIMKEKNIDEDKIQIEVQTMEELKIALAAGAQRVLLDNFTLDALAEAVRFTGGRAQLEASGGADESSLAALAATGVQRISVGALTKHLRAVDFSFLIR